VVGKRKALLLSLLGWLYCLLCPLAILLLTMRYGATEWREEGEPIPWPTHVIDGLFLADCPCTVALIWFVRKSRAFEPVLMTLACLGLIALLCVTGWAAFWGGLWVSGQWL
jgi:hypothetical protein